MLNNFKNKTHSQFVASLRSYVFVLMTITTTSHLNFITFARIYLEWKNTVQEKY